MRYIIRYFRENEQTCFYQTEHDTFASLPSTGDYTIKNGIKTDYIDRLIFPQGGDTVWLTVPETGYNSHDEHAFYVSDIEHYPNMDDSGIYFIDIRVTDITADRLRELDRLEEECYYGGCC